MILSSIVTRQPDGIALRTERNASVDRGTTLGLRFDPKSSVQQLQPLLHAGQAKTSARCHRTVKSQSRIPNCEMNLI